jgi:hypothetical protein
MRKFECWRNEPVLFVKEQEQNNTNS